MGKYTAINDRLTLLREKIIKEFGFFSAVQNKPIVYKKRWNFRGFALIRHSVNNFLIRFGRSTRFIHFISHVR